MDKLKKKTKRLFILWVITYIAVCCISNIYVLYQWYIMGSNPIELLSGYQIISLVIMIVYFIPLLLVVHHYSKLSKMEVIRKVTVFFIVFQGIWTVIMIGLTITSLMKL